MTHSSNELPQVQSILEPGLFVSLKDYLVGEEPAPNPYASIDDFLDETWNVNPTQTDDISTPTRPSSYS